MFLWENRTFPAPENSAFIAIVPEVSAYFYPPDAKTPWSYSWLNFYGPLAVNLCSEIRRQFGPVLPLARKSPAASAYEALVRLAERRTATDPHDTSVACFSFLMEWVRQLSRQSAASPDPVETALRICRTRYHEPIGVKELAAESGITREHFTRIFTEKTGLPPALYLRKLRTEAAAEMLRGGAAVGETALRCGFASPRALNRALADRISSPRPSRGASRRKSTAGRR